VQLSAGGDITCVTQSGDSGTVFVFNTSGVQQAGPLTLAARADVAVAGGGLVAMSGEWVKGNVNGTLPPNFQPEAWIDPNTIFGRMIAPGQPAGNAALAHLTGGGATVENLGFQGDYVGMLSA
jgi:hypothetical protein